MMLDNLLGLPELDLGLGLGLGLEKDLERQR
jgi:hypothetical protein